MTDGKMRVVYLSDEDCPPCEEIKEHLQPYLQQGEMEELSITNDEEGMEIYEALNNVGETSIPRIVLLHQVNDKDYTVALSFSVDDLLTGK